MILKTLYKKLFLFIFTLSYFTIYSYPFNKIILESQSNELEFKIQENIDLVINYGKTFLGKPYKYSPIAGKFFDCSGFIGYIFEHYGINLPRSSASMSLITKKLEFKEIKKGDLLFFKGSNIKKNNVGHVAIVVSANEGKIEMMHSCSKGIVIEDFNNNYYYNKRFLHAGSLSKHYSLMSFENSLNNLKNDIKINNNQVNNFKQLKLVKIIQSKTFIPKDSISVYDNAINSPKSVTYSVNGDKFYINSLEGFTTVVYDSKSFKKIKEIKYHFNEKNNNLFKNNESTIFNYTFKQKREEFNNFKGKPVESCLSHNGKYLWVTFYRRDWDLNAESPSAIAIIDTDFDSIVRVMPTGPLPKMVSASPNNKYIAVTHWGDNTVGLIDISSINPFEFKYISNIIIDYRVNLNFTTTDVDRDNNCGNCLRGTVFTKDNKYVLIGKMGGNGIAVIELETNKYIGTITGSYLNIRHIIINKGFLFTSSNKFGKIQKGNLDTIISKQFDEKNIIEYRDWQTIDVGNGVRTIDITNDGKYLFACVNNESKIVVVDALNMIKMYDVNVASFPVGMALSPNGKQLITTSQGKSSVPGSGNTIMIFDVIYE